jgi:hypothetical protein
MTFFNLAGATLLIEVLILDCHAFYIWPYFILANAERPGDRASKGSRSMISQGWPHLLFYRRTYISFESRDPAWCMHCGVALA